MKIAVFEKEGRVSRQCEDSARVAIVEVDLPSNSVQQTFFLTPPTQTPGTLAGWLRLHDVDVVLASGIRQRERDLIEDKGMKVVAGVPAFRVEPVIANFLAGTLQTGANSCEQQAGVGA